MPRNALLSAVLGLSAAAASAGELAVPPPAEAPPAAYVRRALPRRPPAEPWGSNGPAVHGHAAPVAYSLGMPWGEADFEAFRAIYLTEDGKKWLAAVMRRARPYLAYVEERIRFYGLPDELAFLPVIESEYSSAAVSKSGAAGLWQFMRNSIAGYGMRIDDWVDERRDFMKSTDGALRKLADNYAAFGDWGLAIAAYNAGSGWVGRAVASLRREGIAADFWELRRRGLLPRETAAYVPKFLAVASILRYPGRAGLAPSWDPLPAWQPIAPGKPVDLALLARAADIDLAALRAANSELRYGVTPPAAGYLLKVPTPAAAAVRAALDDPSRALIRYYLHTVRSGDTVSGLSRRYGTPAPAILQANPGLRPELLRLGAVVVVPAFKDAPAQDPAPPQAKGDDLEFSGTYLVGRGDTLWGISLRYDVQPEVLAERNGLALTSVLREGMSLRVPIVR